MSLRDELFIKKENGWLDLSDENKNKIFDFSNEYIEFLSTSKTEREATKNIEELLIKNKFKNINDVDSLKKGDKVYYINKNKGVFASIIGKENIENGISFIGAHLDSPRLDLKPNSLYEDSEMAFLKTHYYGGIKKYQWTTIPLAIHGRIGLKNNQFIDICIGEDDNDPIFTITDLLPHLADEQMNKTLKDGINGESLNLLVGSIPFDKEENAVKLNILNILNKKYGIKESDLLSSEIEIVPAGKARTLGFDESMIAGYGHDDKSCSYAAIMALINTNNSKKTCTCMLVDKEEIGSVGNTGMESNSFNYYISELLNKMGVNKPNLIDKVYMNSKMLSADVDASVDPNYKNVSELNNASFINRGLVINKYTGSGGKSYASDANCEYITFIKNLFEENNIKYQISELGKVDTGGGGTIAYILANKGMDVIDCGIPVLSMHAPMEVISKFDLYEAYKGYCKFFIS